VHDHEAHITNAKRVVFFILHG
jgi:hypothetical protein